MLTIPEQVGDHDILKAKVVGDLKVDGIGEDIAGVEAIPGIGIHNTFADGDGIQLILVVGIVSIRIRSIQYPCSVISSSIARSDCLKANHRMGVASRGHGLVEGRAVIAGAGRNDRSAIGVALSVIDGIGQGDFLHTVGAVAGDRAQWQIKIIIRGIVGLPGNRQGIAGIPRIHCCPGDDIIIPVDGVIRQKILEHEIINRLIGCNIDCYGIGNREIGPSDGLTLRGIGGLGHHHQSWGH